jgi:SAM-dependent methyltransferase
MIGLAAAAVVLLGLTAVVAVTTAGWWWLIPLAYGLFFGISCASFLYTTRRGKFVVWDGLVTQLGLTGRERVVDLGCGRGAVLIMLAGLVPDGRAIGVDVWRSVDQSGNDPTRTRANAAAGAVTVELITADLRALPLATGSVDVVVSSLAIHNIPDDAGRAGAVTEAVRVLRPGGRLVLADFRHARAYADRLAGLGLAEVTVRDLGWRFWYGGPWGRTSAVTATR